jgi:hypothetical protein
MIIQFTETFEKTALFFPQYICIGKINELGEYDNFYNLYNLIFESNFPLTSNRSTMVGITFFPNFISIFIFIALISRQCNKVLNITW